MIPKPSKYDSTHVYEPAERLPAGGYVLKILGTKVENYDWGNVLILRFDVAEGEHAGFYQQNYNDQTEDKKWKGTFRINLPKDDGSEKDDWAIKKLKGSMTAVEHSNDGYTWNWDERTLVGKLVGGLFGNKEWRMNGNSGFYTDCRRLCSVDKIRSGNFKIPEDKLLDDHGNTRREEPQSFGGTQMAFVDCDDNIPF